MDNSYKFYCNKSCEYYPCHKGLSDFNCLFCFCPLYRTECSGSYVMIESDGRKIKDCSNCVFPHLPENYDRIIELLKDQD